MGMVGSLSSSSSSSSSSTAASGSGLTGVAAMGGTSSTAFSTAEPMASAVWATMSILGAALSLERLDRYSISF